MKLLKLLPVLLAISCTTGNEDNKTIGVISRYQDEILIRDTQGKLLEEWDWSDGRAPDTVWCEVEVDSVVISYRYNGTTTKKPEKVIDEKVYSKR